LGATRVESASAVGDAWDDALDHDRPFLIHAVVDAAVPLLPPRLEPTIRERMVTGLEQEATPLAARAKDLLLAELADQSA